MRVVESGTFEAEHNEVGTLIVSAHVKRVLLADNGRRYYVGMHKYANNMIRLQVFVWNRPTSKWRIIEPREDYPVELLPHIAEVAAIAQKCWIKSTGEKVPPRWFTEGSVE